MTKPYDHSEHAAVLAAMSDPDPDNEIAKAIAMRIEALTKVLVTAVERTGEMPRTIEFSKPATALDEASIALFQATMHEQYAAIADMLGKDLSDLPPMPKIVILDHGNQ